MGSWDWGLVRNSGSREACLPQGEGKMRGSRLGRPPPGCHSRERVQKGPLGKGHGLFISVTLMTEPGAQ